MPRPIPSSPEIRSTLRRSASRGAAAAWPSAIRSPVVAWVSAHPAPQARSRSRRTASTTTVMPKSFQRPVPPAEPPIPPVRRYWASTSGSNGPTANDGTADTNPQNFPVLSNTSVWNPNGTVILNGTITSSPKCDPEAGILRKPRPQSVRLCRGGDVSWQSDGDNGRGWRGDIHLYFLAQSAR